MHKKGENGNNRLKAGICKLRGNRKGSERGMCSLCLGEEDGKHILLKFSETRSGGKNV
jgi:hypothetical protein